MLHIDALYCSALYYTMVYCVVLNRTVSYCIILSYTSCNRMGNYSSITTVIDLLFIIQCNVVNYHLMHCIF